MNKSGCFFLFNSKAKIIITSMSKMLCEINFIQTRNEKEQYFFRNSFAEILPGMLIQTWKHSQYFLEHFDFLQLHPFLCLDEDVFIHFPSSCISFSPQIKNWGKETRWATWKMRLPSYLLESWWHYWQLLEQKQEDYELQFVVAYRELCPHIQAC